jgi:Rrf2 family protein
MEIWFLNYIIISREYCSMKGVLKFSTALSMAFHALAVIAARPSRYYSAGELAGAISASEGHLAKVMRRLVQARLVSSVRGPGGGFKLARPASRISLLQIYSAVEGPFEKGACLMDHPCCDEHECIMSQLVDSINRDVFEYLRSRKLSEFSESCRLGREAV